jgi:Spy/CpxP family protein refolding chaperone
MRKTRIIALVVASLVTTASFAGAQAPAQRDSAKSGRHAMGRRMDGGRGGERGLFRGIKLSDAEQVKVKGIRARYAVEAKSLHESMKPVMQEARTLRQKGDTAGLRALWERNKPARDRMQALRVQQQGEIRAALSPENQKQLDANAQELAKRRAEWDRNGKGGKRGELRGRADRGSRVG